VFLAVTLVLVIFGGVLTLQGFQARIKQDYEKRDREQEKEICTTLMRIIDLSEETLDNIQSDKVLVDALTPGRKNSIEIYASLYGKTKDIRSFSNIDMYMGKNCMYSTKSGFKSEALPENYSVLKEANSAGGKTVYALDPGNASESGAALLVARQVVKGSTPGYVVIRIEQQELTSQLSSHINAKDGFMLTNRFFRPFCLIGTARNGDALSHIRKNLLNGQLYNTGLTGNVYITELGDSGLLSIYTTPPALEESAIKAGYQIISIQVVISILVCLIVASRLSIYFSKPIAELSGAMKRFRKGDFDAKIELSREDEFEQLATGFNKMTTQLKDTMDERVQAERKVNETRIQMMQAQLNPHFLYNTLDTIKWVAKANQVPEVATMSASLAGILRTSISERQFCELSKELELIENYVEIQKIRFDDKFSLTIDVPEDVAQAIIPKLILQPIVENAIIHGMDETENGHIYVAAIRDRRDGNDLLKISVQDDGKGISDEMMTALNNDDVETLKGHLGLNNVNTIIRLYYGKEYGVMAFRPSQGGTVMIVTLPYSEKEPEENGVDNIGDKK
jgi:two-component system sensor histidine kinase YesM